MTSFKQTRLLSCIVSLYERSMYPFHSSGTRNSLLRHDTAEEKKKESYYDEALHVSVSFICISASTLDGGRV